MRTIHGRKHHWLWAAWLFLLLAFTAPAAGQVETADEPLASEDAIGFEPTVFFAQELVEPDEVEEPAAPSTSRRSRGRRTRAPSMIGDFFGVTSGGTSIVTNLDDRAVHHTTSVNDFHAIDESGPFTVFVGGPNAGRFYFTGAPFSGPPPPVGPVVTDLIRSDFTPGFIAVETTDTATILPAFDNGNGLTNVPVYAVGLPMMLNLPSPGAGGAVVGRVKLAENTSPLPQDRVFVNYSYFDNVALTSSGVAVNRFTPGFEKTFFDRLASLDVRFPVANTLSSDILSSGGTDLSNAEFGNISLTGKVLLTSNETWATSAGIQIGLPTADATRVLTAGGTPLVEISNRAVHLKPFLGVIYSPSDRLFAQGFVQVDVDANGNPVSVNGTGQGLVPTGRLNDATFLFVDVSFGWRPDALQNPDSWLTGVMPMVELHYNRSLHSSDVVSAPGFRVGSVADTFEVVNAVIGTTLEFASDDSLTIGYTAPIGGGVDQPFDGELRIFYTRYFGGS